MYSIIVKYLNGVVRLNELEESGEVEHIIDQMAQELCTLIEKQLKLLSYELIVVAKGE